MNQLKIFIDLTRLNKPIGFMLLFWPCSWGLAFAYNFNLDTNKFLYFLLLLFLEQKVDQYHQVKLVFKHLFYM